MKTFPKKEYIYNRYDDVADLYELTSVEEKKFEDVAAIYVCKRTWHTLRQYYFEAKWKNYPDLVTDEDHEEYLKYSFEQCKIHRTAKLENKLKELKEDIACFERNIRALKDSAEKIKDQLAKPLQYSN